jgi:phosphoribosylformimino-5-aminoimidazole carboxamide ribotide isomerase
MLLIPAIDLKEGKCVRLRQGRMDDNTVSDDLSLRAVAGARLHLVDLDGAFAGKPRNADVIQPLLKPTLMCQ